MIMFNYRCYVESGLDDVTQNSWIHELTLKIKSLRNHSICIYLKSPKSLDCHLNRPKRLLTDLLTSSGRTGLNGQRRLYVISTDDSGIVNYGLRILKSYPQSPLTCFIDPVGAFNDSVASDFIFRWNNDQTLDLMGHKKPSLQLEPTFNQFESHDQSYFDPLIWIFKAYGPPKVPVLTLETLVEILKAWDFPIPSNELNSREDSILKYIRSALSSRLIRFCSKLEDENSLLDSINRRTNYLILEESICSSDLLG
ncbi:hypothetical protein BY996DRAFT_2922203 [Phakopsora pachyrhizi]|nr:hypothetical protein BY996DRAFT_2922203 [Phakopsora pachyrhizi]